MSSMIKTAASLACLAAVTLATPLNSGASNVLPRQHETDCSSGKVFYSCANGYRGCFETDPCALPAIIITTTATFSTSIVSATSTSSTSSATTVAAAGACPTAGTTGSIWQPTMYNLYPSEPDLAQTPVSYLQVQVHGTDPQLEQAVVFRGIPAEAKTCTLSWAQADASERNFVVVDSGLISVQPLAGFPDVGQGEPVTSDSVDAFVDPAVKPLRPDFTFWDKTEAATPHTAGPIDCAQDVYFKVNIDARNGDGHVYLEQDAKNGFYIEYTC
ncbi:hypothetical protein AAE478_002134 [Parahypoxylon ruwenzoriense]